MQSPRKGQLPGEDSWPNPSPNFRFSGFLAKLGEGRVAWKTRFMHIDATTGYLYWWNKPDGKVLGAISLADTILTAMPAPEFSFRLSRSGRFRDFRADSASNLATWLKHLNEEIAARSGGGSGAGGIGGGDKNASAPVPAAKLTMSRRDGMEMSGQMTAGGDISKQSDDRAKQLEEKNKQLEAEILILKQRVKELEAKNAGLEAASGGGGGGGRTAVEEPEDAKAAELLKAMNMGGDANMRDQVEDLTFQLKAAQKRLKQAAQTIKTQAQRIQLLEGNDKT